jgi:hypothetical protein
MLQRLPLVCIRSRPRAMWAKHTLRQAAAVLAEDCIIRAACGLLLELLMGCSHQDHS